jgi:predicted dehydrogenase
VRYTTDLDAALSDRSLSVYFDAQVTERRVPAVRQAIAAGKHVYCEKPTATTTAAAHELYRVAAAAGVKHGVVQDKLWLPGIRKLKWLIDTGFFGRILSVRGEFGYWVFEGNDVPCQRPSWNYRKEDGGGIILDMFCHWQYVIEGLFAPIRSVSCLGATHVGERWDEAGKPYKATADDAAYATFQLADGVVCQFNSSWSVRVRRDDLLTIQVDGTKGSAVAGLRDCVVQHASATPRAIWNPDIDSPIRFFDGWSQVPQHTPFDNAFKVQWELFLKHVVGGGPFPWDLLAAARGVQLAEKGLESWARRSWVDLPALEA